MSDGSRPDIEVRVSQLETQMGNILTGIKAIGEKVEGIEAALIGTLEGGRAGLVTRVKSLEKLEKDRKDLEEKRSRRVWAIAIPLVLLVVKAGWDLLTRGLG